MFLIREEFHKLELQIQEKEEQIYEYENSGKMAKLLKRINYLEEQEKNHLSTI